MTVAELIAKLQMYPPDLEVYTADENYGEPQNEVFNVIQCSKRVSTLFPQLNDFTQVILLN